MTDTSNASQGGAPSASSHSSGAIDVVREKPSEEMQRFSGVIRSRRGISPETIEARRDQMEAMQARLRIEDDVVQENVSHGELSMRWLRAGTPGTAGVVLYLHGGGYVLGSLNTHAELMSRIARVCDAGVLGVDYRLAPEHPYPAAVEDAVAAYEWLLSEGVQADRIVIAGDSAGGGLALACTLALKAAKRPLPRALALFSPWTDLTFSGDSINTRAAADPMIQPENLQATAQRYYGATDPRHPEVSPVFADFRDLPPMLVQVGADEVLYDDALRIVEAANAAGGMARLEVWSGAFHVFQSLPQLPEAQDALERVGNFFSAAMKGELGG